jgi:hypothetical protein
VHYHAWRVWLRFKNRKRTAAERNEGQQIFSDNVNEQVSHFFFQSYTYFQEVLDKVRLIRFPPLVVFMFAILYGIIASLIIYRNEKWTYLETVYFTFISILTVGFGDFRPLPQNLFTVLLIVLGGITVSTM